MMEKSENAWILAACSAVTCIFLIPSVSRSRSKIKSRYKEWIDDEEDSHEELELIKALKKRRTLSLGYIAVFAMVLAFMIVYIVNSVNP
jgi:hypothetical protein